MRVRVATLLVALTAAVLLAGCSGASTDTTAPDIGQAEVGVSDGRVVEGGAPAMEGEMAVPEAAPGAVSAPIDRQVVRTGYLSMRSEDVTKTAFDVHALVARHRGLISSEDTQSNGDATYSNITAQIPAAELDKFVAEVSALGTVDSININAQDVTTQVVDLDARIKALQTSIDRMTQLMAQATRIEDLLAIEMQLSHRQAELDSLQAQRDYLGDQVAMSTITVSLSPITKVTDVDAPGFLSGLQSGWAAFVALIMVAVTALGFFLPFLVVSAIVTVPVVIIIVRQARRHRRHPDPVAPPANGREADPPTTT